MPSKKRPKAVYRRPCRALTSRYREHSAGVSVSDLAEAQQRLLEKIREVNNGGEKSVDQKKAETAALNEERTALAGATQRLKEYNEAHILGPLGEANEALKQANYLLDVQAGTVGNAIAALEKLDRAKRDAYENDKKAREEKGLSVDPAAEAAYRDGLRERSKSLQDLYHAKRDAERKGMADEANAVAEAKRARVEALQSYLQYHEMVGTKTIAEEKAVAAAAKRGA